ncbi:hypothetical protein EI546_15260 [Aequorivita sp. H23M31]|uniref:DUF3575 domain-containing protein n=1 Tax=Aequorivita ciconiae TaxID=2494375 RepID=A0A410G6R1_9FLAO|nr:hypothetical protein [Aequorivita sp. H23M31]QAA82989.1 hypothetical protein EI546_15260 [Aequorivita sp. H23M31]
MKKLFFIAIILTAFDGFSQETDNSQEIPQGKHDLRFDGFEALVFETLEFNYEYVIGKYSGAGAAISFNLGEKSFEGSGTKFAFTPYYRQYFLNKKDYGARGLFVEGSIQFASGKYDGYSYFYDPSIDYYQQIMTTEKWFETGIGLSVGQKWVSHNGFIFEISAGGGRYLLNDEAAPAGYFRGGILVGYRF